MSVKQRAALSAAKVAPLLLLLHLQSLNHCMLQTDSAG